MRQIKFRGRRIDNGEWIYGDLIHEPWGTMIQSELQLKFTVDSATVGEWTGLVDKNGVTEIYEGDICRNESGEVGQIVFVNGAFVSMFLPPYDWDPMAPCDGGLAHQEVIGNAHDTPHLLEDDNGRVG